MLRRVLRNTFKTLEIEELVVQENLDESVEFDFTLRRFEKEILVSLKYEENAALLSKQELLALNEILGKNLSSEGIVVVWISKPNYPSIYLSGLNLRKLLSEDRVTFSFHNELKPLKECILSIFKNLVSLVIDSTRGKGSETVEGDRIKLRQSFAEILGDELQKMKNKGLSKYSLKAIEEFSVEDMNRLEHIFEMALEEEFDLEALESLLIEISEDRRKRG